MTATPRGADGWRATAAVAAVRATNRLSRRLGRGSGTVAGGRAGLAVDPDLLAHLAAGRSVALVSGTNGKTTTTRLLVAAAATLTGRPVASNTTGANMPAGHVAALAGAPDDPVAVLEVDEGYLGHVVAATRPAVVVLLNLSRDQLDRIAEVRMLADRWRAALADAGPSGPTVVANADDPLVVHAAGTAARVVWVGAGQVWHEDAVGCPSCGGRIVFAADGGWACDRCGSTRPDRAAGLQGDDVVLADGTRVPVRLQLPGRFNRANASMVAVAAPLLAGRPVDGGAVAAALDAMATVGSVEGRYSTATWRGHPVRLLLAKNPAGWTALFDLLDEDPVGGPPVPVVCSINARVADGHDPSWLWDVPFERLAGRPVVATGDRRLDLAVRLRYAGVPHTVAAGPAAALDRAVADGAPGADFLGNYTAFADVRRVVAP